MPRRIELPNYLVRAVGLLIVTIIFMLIFGFLAKYLANYSDLSTLQNMNNSNSGNTSRNTQDSVTPVTNTAVTLPAKDYDVNNFDYSTTPNSAASNLYQAIEKVDDLREFKYIGRNLALVKPDAFIKKKNLRILILRSNPLVIDPGQIWIYHSGIVILDISDSNLSALNPVVFKGLPKLKLLIMSGNPGCEETRDLALLAGAHFRVDCHT